MSETLTYDQICKLQGRELDARIICHLFGFKWWKYKRDELYRSKSYGLHCLASADAEYIDGLPRDRFERAELWPHEPQRISGWDWATFPGDRGIVENLPHYSTDLGACQEVLNWIYQELREKQQILSLSGYPRLTGFHWYAEWFTVGSNPEGKADAKTLPEAVCKLALLRFFSTARREVIR